MDPISIVSLLLVIIVAGFAGYLFMQNKKLQNQPKQVIVEQQKTSPLSELEAIEKASSIAKQKIIDAEKKALELEKAAQNEIQRKQTKLKEEEKLLDEREQKLLNRGESLNKRFDDLEVKEKQIEDQQKELKAKNDEISLKLEKMAQMTKQEAEELLKKQVEESLIDWKAKKIKETEEKIKLQGDEISTQLLIDIMANSAVDMVAETTATTIQIDDESLKSRIIGKSGRNVRTLQNLTGADIIIDESPNEVTVSCFDPIRREVAALTLQNLLKTGKISPVTIEEMVEKVKKDILKEIKKTGEELAFESGFPELPVELIMLLGRFKYRFSYGQNLAKHSLEMVKIAEALAIELKADVKIAKLAALLHDIGKVAPQEGKQHHHISAELAEKYYKDDRLINAIAAHHFDIDAKYIEAEIIRIADAVSGARPGARRDSYEDYIKRIRALEDIANKHKGVRESYAIQAGREVRVIVTPEMVNDENTKVMAYEIAREIEASQNYPGVVRVTVIRELRAIEEAK